MKDQSYTAEQIAEYARQAKLDQLPLDHRNDVRVRLQVAKNDIAICQKDNPNQFMSGRLSLASHFLTLADMMMTGEPMDLIWHNLEMAVLWIWRVFYVQSRSRMDNFFTMPRLEEPHSIYQKDFDI